MKKQHIILLDFLFICILIFLLGLSFLSYQRIEKLKTATDWVNHSTVVKLKLNRTLIHVIDAESGQRGYLLTRDSTFLRQYRSAFSRASAEISDVIRLTSDNESQKQKAIALRALVKSRFEELGKIIAYTNGKDKSSVGLTMLLKRGQKVMEMTRSMAIEMIKYENKLLEARTKEKEQVGSLTPVLVLLFSVMAIIFVVFAYLKMRSETHLRMHAQDSEALSRKLQEESAALNHLLETKVKERTRELRQKNVALENMNDELLSFNYVASHDLQEPLRKIQAFSNRILESDEKFSPTTTDYFGRIVSAAVRMQKLLEALISYSRANNSEQDFTDTDLNAMIDDIKTDLRETIDEKKAVIIHNQLPTLHVIPLQIHQLFVNLISNSVKYSRKDTIPKINITAQRLNVEDIKKRVYLHHKSYWEIAFEDNGIGFESQYEDKIFELFQRLHGKNEFEGTGIGLAICKKIVQNHDGYIFAEGRPDNGATFFIYFPA